MSPTRHGEATLQVQLKKGRDGRPTLVCIRADGTRTWSKVHPFFPVHDLTHYAVESVFGFDEAFFGLVASGWDIDDFAEPGAARDLPTQALWAEGIVGLLDLERGMLRRLSAADFSESLAASLDGQGVPAFRPLNEGELGRVRKLRGELQERWRALDPGDTMEVRFPAVDGSPS